MRQQITNFPAQGICLIFLHFPDQTDIAHPYDTIFLREKRLSESFLDATFADDVALLCHRDEVLSSLITPDMIRITPDNPHRNIWIAAARDAFGHEAMIVQGTDALILKQMLVLQTSPTEILPGVALLCAAERTTFLPSSSGHDFW